MMLGTLKGLGPSMGVFVLCRVKSFDSGVLPVIIIIIIIHVLVVDGSSAVTAS